ncbi:MAG: hypothetical protein JXA54_13460 [Candidatus Heimdallarchaeota archaeon]|nr:hypothetical protein [Candidatus Heimdallarchaeota archaeon]
MLKTCYTSTDLLSTEPIDVYDIKYPTSQEEFQNNIDNKQISFDSYFDALSRFLVDYFIAIKSFTKYKKIDLFSVYSLYNKSLFSNSESLFDILSTLNESGYLFTKKKEISNFLLEHQSLLPLLQKAISVIRSYFIESEFKLDVFNDPEDKKSKMLLLNIYTKIPLKEAYKKLNLLEDQWWLEVSRELGDLICLDVIEVK